MILKNSIVSLFLRHFKQCYQVNHPEIISWLKVKRRFFLRFSVVFFYFFFVLFSVFSMKYVFPLFLIE